MRRDTNIRTGVVACTLAAFCALIVPGTGHLAIRARFRPLVVLAAALNALASVGLVVVLLPVRSRSDLAAIIADRTTFIGLGAALVVLAATRLWSALDSAWLARPSDGVALRLTASITTGLLVISGVAPLAIAAGYVWQTDQAVERVFATTAAVTAYPTPLPPETTGATVTAEATTTPSATVANATVDAVATVEEALPPVAPPTTRPPVPTTTTTLPPMVAVDRVNVLLLGGDAGPGRWSLRTDSMVVVSVDPTVGDTAMISVPRNLRRLPFPAGTPLAARYPRGFTDIANAVYPIVNLHRELAGGADDAGAQAIKQGIAQLLGMPIHYYVLVDMAGFVDVVDALGGVDINVTKRVPAPGNPIGAKHEVPAWFEVGTQHMDGTLTLSYARSRSADTDYNRMARQRCVLGAIASAATPTAVATGLGDLVAAFGDAVRTDVPRERLGELSQLVDRFTQAGGLGTVRTLHLAPPLVDPRSWNALKVRQLVAGVITPGSPIAAPSPPPVKVLTDACG